jgi:hypothetical protein
MSGLTHDLEINNVTMPSTDYALQSVSIERHEFAIIPLIIRRRLLQTYLVVGSSVIRTRPLY